MDYVDINSEVCINCGACCKIFLPVQGDERYFEFLKEIGINVTRSSEAKSLGKIELGFCRDTTNGQYKCKKYADRPQLCIDFNCLAWANYNNIKDDTERFEAFTKAKSVYQQILNNKKKNNIGNL